MAKQSKITVKHYLNTNVKSTYILDKEDKDYPIYCRLSYKRKTISFRSFTGLLMTENEFEFYLKNEYIQRKKYTLSDIAQDYTLNDEVKYIDAIIKILQNNNDEIDIFKTNFTDDLRSYFEYAKKEILLVTWKNYLNISLTESVYNSEPNNEIKRLNKIYSKNGKNPNEFSNILNNDNTLLENIENLKNITKYDITDYFNNETILFWKVVEIIINEYDNKPIIDVLVNSNVEKISKLCKKQNLILSKEFTIKIYNNLIISILDNIRYVPF